MASAPRRDAPAAPAVPQARRLAAIVLSAAFCASYLGAGWDGGTDRAGGVRARSIAPARTVVLVSFDGLRWDDPRRVEGASFERMQREGGSARGLIPPFPASTFPAHATLATGVHPDRHGIVANRFLDVDRGAYGKEDDPSWLLSEPLWVTAERQGVTAAVAHWAFSNGPWHGTAATIRVPYDPGLSDSRRVDAIIEWLRLPDGKKPGLIMSYMHGVDGTAHRYGPAGTKVDEAVRSLDRLLGRLLDEAATSDGEVAVIVVSDHGMTATTRVHRLDQLLSGDAGRVRAFSSGGSANLYCPDQPACRAAQDQLEMISSLQLFSLEAMPPGLHCGLPGRTGDLVVMASPGEVVLTRPARGGNVARGTHGYGPEVTDMWGVFFAWGAGIRPGARVEQMRSVDFSSLVCRLLGIREPGGIDGRLRDELLADQEDRRSEPDPPRE